MAKDTPRPWMMEADIHGMTKAQAVIYIESMLKKAGGSVYRIRVIHGYHGGTELRTMVRKKYAKDPRVKRIEIGMNQGETELILKELY